ncbi:hypothetical protein SR870_11120 [Rhodopseudomonas palustris]|uniref:hypothetical protein n=1 Tax=Rhodopseudomonas palustris TaxID=1076 RepID=UPI002ACD6F74|nr:hypothetical protein [Rhodopseudomonas palustris]WQH01785.1 hypothetical protein SR870_11120 [Rhodopseudomonas palustris]
MNEINSWTFDLISWLERHDKLAGWAQFFGTMIAIAITYFTAFAPTWRRKRQLKNAAVRLLSHGYEVLESYHRTSAHFLPFPLSLRQAALSMTTVANEINRFPIFELNDQGSRSTARYLAATSWTLNGVRLFLETIATEIEGRKATKEDQETIRQFVGQQIEVLQKMFSGADLERPRWHAPNQ